MAKWLLVLTLGCAAVLSPVRAWAQAPAQTPAQEPAQAIDPAFERDIVHLLEMTGAQKIGAQIAGIVTQQIADQLRRANPNIPPRIVEIAGETTRQVFEAEFGTLQPRLVAAYAKVVTPDDVRQLIAFYETPFGKRMIELSPLLAQAGAQAGQAWGQGLAPRLQAELQKRLKAEGLIP